MPTTAQTSINISGTTECLEWPLNVTGRYYTWKCDFGGKKARGRHIKMKSWTPVLSSVCIYGCKSNSVDLTFSEFNINSPHVCAFCAVMDTVFAQVGAPELHTMHHTIKSSHADAWTLVAVDQRCICLSFWLHELIGFTASLTAYR